MSVLKNVYPSVRATDRLPTGGSRKGPLGPMYCVLVGGTSVTFNGKFNTCLYSKDKSDFYRCKCRNVDVEGFIPI